ncbi:MAG TPA: molecular chaperone GroEL [Peptococcaceae bacterium]|nr:molecular chaperone GroEL [Peptococcaceae bacterium]
MNFQTSTFLNDVKARNALISGFNQVADMVKPTIGPCGKNIVIERALGYPLITKDGATVAKYIKLTNLQEDLGAKLCREVAMRTNELVGDGTTTSIVLAQAIINGSLPLIEAGLNPIQLRKGIEKAVNTAIEEIENLSIPVTIPDGVFQVAAISSKNTYIGELIAKAFNKIGKDGTVFVQESTERSTSIEISQGLELDNGYMSPYFASEGMDISLESPYILITDHVLNETSDVKRVLSWCSWEKKALLIITPNIKKDVLGVLFSYNTAETGKVVAVKAPGFGDFRQGLLEDLALVTNGTFITKELGMSLGNIEKAMLGKAEKVIVTRHKTTILGGDGSRQNIDKQIRKVKTLISQTSQTEDRDRLLKRLTLLSGGIAVIQVGADTDMALKELKDRVIKGVKASKAAIEKGIVPGGGTAFIRAAQALDKIKTDNWYEMAGIRLIKQALEAPLIQIVNNAGGNGKNIVELLKKHDKNTGYDAVAGIFVDMINVGIVDPAKVTITALRNAMGIASLLFTVEGSVGNKSRKGDNRE